MQLSDFTEQFKKLPTRKQAQLVNALFYAGDFSQSGDFFDLEVAFGRIAGDLAQDEGWGLCRAEDYLKIDDAPDFWPADGLELVERFEPLVVDNAKGIML